MILLTSDLHTCAIAACRVCDNRCRFPRVLVPGLCHRHVTSPMRTPRFLGRSLSRPTYWLVLFGGRVEFACAQNSAPFVYVALSRVLFLQHISDREEIKDAEARYGNFRYFLKTSCVRISQLHASPNLHIVRQVLGI